MTAPEEKAYVLRSRGQWLYNAGRHTEALEDIDAAIVLAPENIDARLYKASLLELLEDADAALAELDRALELDSEERKSDVLLARSHLRLRQGDHTLARKDVDAAIELNGGNAGGYWLRGWINELERDYRAAIADYDAAIGGEEPSLYYTEWKVRLLLNKDAQGIYDPQAARQLAAELCEKTQQETPEYLELLAQACAACGDHAQAIDRERQAMALREQWDRLNNLKRIRDYKQAAEEKAPAPAAE